jgi:DNA-binding transcriptional MerR regulator
MSELLQTADAAKAADVTPSAIHRAANEGRLKVAAVTRRGTRLYRAADVEEYRQARLRLSEKAAGR